MKCYTFCVNGTHCQSCKILIEDTLGEQDGVVSVAVDLGAQTVTVQGAMEDTPEALAEKWSHLLAPHAYTLSLEKQTRPQDWSSFTYALPIGLIVLGLFFLLQKSGVLNIGFEGGLTPWTALLIGGIASLSTCPAVVGGLVLSPSA